MIPDDERRSLLAKEFARPIESRNARHIRELRERDARWAAERREREATEAQVLVQLEKKLSEKFGGLIEEQREFVHEIIAEAFEAFSEEYIEKRFAEMQAAIDALKQRNSEPQIIDLPAVLPTRRVQ
jgi:hypothetical protein